MRLDYSAYKNYAYISLDQYIYISCHVIRKCEFKYLHLYLLDLNVEIELTEVKVGGSISGIWETTHLPLP